MYSFFPFEYLSFYSNIHYFSFYKFPFLSLISFFFVSCEWRLLIYRYQRDLKIKYEGTDY